MKKEKIGKKAGVRHGIFGGLIVVFVVAIISLYAMNMDVHVSEMKVRKWTNQFGSVGDNPALGADAGGCLMVYLVDHSVGWDFTTNITVNSSVWASGELNNTQISTAVPHSQAFDVVFKVRWNVSQAYAVGNSSWVSSWCRGYFNSTDLGQAALTLMDKYVIPNNGTKFMHMHFVWDGTFGVGGAGETITEGQNITSCVGTFQAYTY